ncbi:hypothetical protein C8R45DRAFT_1101461 [Mycena sanguinolenta]|nr:hypothetical protein C8R45DRAFT_1101461 [Mycena sanguinolenta]
MNSKTASGKPELHGGIGGKGGDSDKKGGGGGDSESLGVPNTLLSWFVNIWGGIGEQGGRGGADGTNGTRVKNGTGQNLQYSQSSVTLWERFQRMLPSSWATMTGTYIVGTAPCVVSAIDSSKVKIGGVGGKGGSGSLTGGKGGGVGGEDGFGGYCGGRGGIGRGSVFYEVLGHPHKKTLNAPPTLLAGYPIVKDPEEAEKLRRMLRAQGFAIVGALFVVTEEDLAKRRFSLNAFAETDSVF